MFALWVLRAADYATGRWARLDQESRQAAKPPTLGKKEGSTGQDDPPASGPEVALAEVDE